MARDTIPYNSDRFRMEGQGRSTVQWAMHPFDCPLFETYGILSVGYSRTGAGYRILRKSPEFSNIHVTMSGRGEAWIGGRWQTISEGMAILSPRGVPHGTRATPRTSWEFCWRKPGPLTAEGISRPSKRMFSWASPSRSSYRRLPPRQMVWCVKNMFGTDRQSSVGSVFAGGRT